MPEKKIEVEYTKATIGKRLLASLVDFFCLFFIAFVIYSLSNMAYEKTSSYQGLLSTREEIKLESGLYTEDGTLIVEYATSDTSFTSYEERKDYLSQKIDAFYLNEKFFDLSNNTSKADYEERKLEYKTDDETFLFEEQDGKVVERNVKPEELFSFYSDEVNNYCLKYLFNSDGYSYTTRMIFIVSVVIFLISLIVSYTIFYLIFPLTFLKRGRQTLGMKLFNISLIGYNALNITTGKYVGRFFFNLLIMVILDFFSFLLPMIVSVSMMYFTKTNQNLTNYVFNDYAVDTKDDDVYLNYLEYLDKKSTSTQAKLENQDLVIK